MDHEPAGDLGVDVLIFGSGLQAYYLADALHPRFSVCVVEDPSHPVEVLDDDGLFAAGYDGNDVARIQPARRAASFWRMWATDHGLDADAVPVLRTRVPETDRATTALWSDAALPFVPAGDLPEAMRGGVADQATTVRCPIDVVLSPAAVLGVFRDRVADQAIDLVELDVDGELVPVVARFVVFAADAANGELARQLTSRFGDPERRRDAKAAVRSCQANVRQSVVAVRGPLPLVAGRFGDVWVTAHPDPRGGDDVVWLASVRPDPADTTEGPDDVRFDAPVRAEAVATVTESLFALSPWLFRHAHLLQWATFGRRHTQHPMVATTDTIGEPVPARLDNFGLDAFFALWPSHPAYAMVLGDVAAERIAAQLGTSAAFSEGRTPLDLRTGPLPPITDRWWSPRTHWLDWDDYAERNDIRAG
jgi:hypothetical protein